MDTFDLLVINGLVVTASDTANYDIAIDHGKVVLLAPQGLLSKEKAKRVIDADGGYVMVAPLNPLNPTLPQSLTTFHSAGRYRLPCPPRGTCPLRR